MFSPPKRWSCFRGSGNIWNLQVKKCYESRTWPSWKLHWTHWIRWALVALSNVQTVRNPGKMRIHRYFASVSFISRFLHGLNITFWWLRYWLIPCQIWQVVVDDLCFVKISCWGEKPAMNTFTNAAGTSWDNSSSFQFFCPYGKWQAAPVAPSGEPCHRCTLRTSRTTGTRTRLRLSLARVARSKPWFALVCWLSHRGHQEPIGSFP